MDEEKVRQLASKLCNTIDRKYTRQFDLQSALGGRGSKQLSDLLDTILEEDDKLEKEEVK
jgi:hypothetical protein